MLATVPATLIISCLNFHGIENEIEDGGEEVRIKISDFVFFPKGTMVTLHDKDKCLFEDVAITEVYINNRYGGILVGIEVSAQTFKMLLEAPVHEMGYTKYRYPNTLSLFNNNHPN